MQSNLSKITPIVLDYFAALDLDSCIVHDTIEKPLLTGPLHSLRILGICQQLLHCLLSVQFLCFSQALFTLGMYGLLVAIQGHCQIP